MKIFKLNNSWQEVTTTTIHIDEVWRGHFNNQSVDGWIRSNKRTRMCKQWRKYCACCKTPWEDKIGNVIFVSTDNGNKIICEGCAKDMEVV